MTNPLEDDELQRAVVEAYERGDKIRDIEERLGIARATVYWHLERGGVAPKRLQRGRRGADDQHVAQLYLLIESQQQQISELVAAGRALTQALRDRIAALEADAPGVRRPRAFWRELYKILDEYVKKIDDLE